MVNVESALAFVAHQGNRAEQARLKYLVAQETPLPTVISQLLAGQRDDGGWSPFWATDYSSLDATCFRLAQSEQLGINHSHAAVTRAVKFLAVRQQSDGSWEEDTAAAAGAPRWVKPGDVAARLYLTANCSFWLAMSGEPAGATKAAACLQAHLDKNGHMPSFPHTHWLAAGVWYRLNRDVLPSRGRGLGRASPGAARMSRVERAVRDPDWTGRGDHRPFRHAVVYPGHDHRATTAP